MDRAVLCLEGGTDKEILDAACKVLFEAPLPFEIVAKPGMGAGVGWATGYATARAFLPDLRMKTAVLVDDDDAGRHSHRILMQRLKTMEKPDAVKAFIVGKDKANDELRRVTQGGFLISIAMEEICGIAAWDHAEKKDWLELRPDVIKQNADKLTAEDTFTELVKKRLTEASSQRLVRMRVKANRKGHFARFVATQITDTNTVPPTLEKLVRSIHSYFS